MSDDAMKRAIDDEGETFYFCRKHAEMFEGGMSEMHDVPRTVKAAP